jgi:hypothetical protein
MAYDTKVLLLAIAEIVKLSHNKRDIYAAIAKMANAEGVILEPLDLKEGE